MMTRSSRSYCGVRVVSCACGRTSAKTRRRRRSRPARATRRRAPRSSGARAGGSAPPPASAAAGSAGRGCGSSTPPARPAGAATTTRTRGEGTAASRCAAGSLRPAWEAEATASSASVGYWAACGARPTAASSARSRTWCPSRSGSLSTALRNSSSARPSQPSRVSGASSTLAFWKNAHADQKCGDASAGARCARSITSS